MDTVDITITMPRTLLSILETPRITSVQRIKELIALELFREQEISAGKAAEILGIHKYEFIDLLAKHKIPYFQYTIEEVISEVADVQKAMKADS